MSNKLTIIHKKKAAGGNVITSVFQCIVSGAYVKGGAVGVAGETLSFNTALNPGFIARPRIPGAPAGRLPPNNQIRVVRAPDGYDALVEQNAVAPTPNNFVLRIFSSGDTELASGNYAAGLTADLTGFIIEMDIPLKYV